MGNERRSFTSFVSPFRISILYRLPASPFCAATFFPYHWLRRTDQVALRGPENGCDYDVIPAFWIVRLVAIPTVDVAVVAAGGNGLLLTCWILLCDRTGSSS
jgi:hypothetical protein